MQIIHSAEGKTVERSALAIFEGGLVWARGLMGSEGSHDFNVTLIQFAAGARTVMHRHSSDQVLYVTAGIGKVGDAKGAEVISVGDSVVISCQYRPLARRSRHRFAHVPHQRDGGGE